MRTLCAPLWCCALLALHCRKERADADPPPRTQASLPAPRTSAPELAPAPGGTCANYADCRAVGRIASDELTEISGLAASRAHPGVLYVHNDSGDDARFFALDTRGAVLAEYELAGVDWRDVEDMAVGPGPGGASYLYFADTGDNAARTGLGRTRRRVTVFRTAEPPRGSPGTRVRLDAVEALRFTYPDEPHDAEALLIDPERGDLFVVTKETDGRSHVFHAPAPQTPGTTRTFESAGRLEFGRGALAGNRLVTAGDVAPKGAAILLRTYTHVFEWRRAPGQPIREALTGIPRSVPIPLQPQGEALGFAADSLGYYSVSETERQPLYFCGCR